MRKTAIAAAALTFVLALPISARAAFVVIVNSGNDVASVDEELLQAVYLGKKTLWENGTRITPGLPTEEKPEGEEFIKEVLKKSVSQYRSYWKRKLFSGGGTVPKTFRTPGEIAEFVAKTPGAIAVIPADPKNPSIRVVPMTTPK